MNLRGSQPILQEKTSEGTQLMKDETNIGIIIKMRPVLIGNSHSIAITKLIFFLVNTVLSLLYFLFNSTKGTNLSTLIQEYAKDIIKINQQLVLVSSFVTSIVIILNIIYYNLIQSNMHKIVVYTSQKLNAMLPALIQINTTVSALLFIINNELIDIKFVNLAVTFTISVFVCIFMQCTSKPSDLLNSSHPLFIVIFRISSLILLLMSTVCYVFGLSQYIVLSLGAILLIIVSSAFLSNGYRTYRNKRSKLSLLVQITFFQSTCISILISIGVNSSYFDFLFTLAVIFIILFFIVQNKSRFVFNPINFGLRDIQILLSSFQELVDNINLDQKCFLIGLLHHHKQIICKNIHCYSHKKQVYCTALEGNVDINNDNKFDSIFRYFIKCFFEQSIQRQPQNYQILLGYCQYSYYQMSNILPLALHLEKLQKVRLSLYQQIRVFNLKKSLRQDLGKSSHAGLNSSLHFQRVIEYEATCSQIAHANFQIIQNNINLWNLFSTPTLQASNVLSLTNSIVQACKEVQKKILDVQQQFKAWPRLQRLIAFYALYIDNSFKKDKTVLILEKALMGKKGNQKDCNLNKQSREFLSGESVFGEDTVIIHNGLYCGRLLVKHCSAGTKRILGFGKQDLIGCDIATIMPQFLRDHHLEKLAHWMDQGFVNHERFERGVPTFCLAKCSRIHSITKTFKLFLTDEGEVNFVCLLKEDPIRINSVICNKQLEIEELSQQFQQTFQTLLNGLSLSQQKINLKSLIPSINQILKEFSDQIKQLKNVCFCLHIRNEPFIAQISILDYGQEKILFTFKPTFGQASQQQTIHSIKTFNKVETQSLQLQILNDKQNQEQSLTNIFRKEEGTTPNESMKEISHIKYTLHAFFLSLVTIFIAMMTITNSNYLTLEDYIGQYQVFLKVTKEPLLLSIRYYLLQCNISDQSSLIRARTDAVLQQSQKDSFKRTLFNTLFSFSNDDQSKSTKLKEKADIFYAIFSSISSFKNGSIDFKSTQFQTFKEAIFPNLYNMIDFFKEKIYSTYHQLYRNISVPNFILLQAQSALFALVLILVTYKFVVLCKKIKQSFKIIVKVDKEELKNNKRHWNNLLNLFTSYECGRKIKRKSILINSYSSKNQIESDKKLVRQQLCIYSRAVFSLSFKFLLTALLQVFISSKISSLEEFGNISQPLYDFYPSSTTIGFGMMQKYYNSTFLNISQSAYNDYKNVIIDLEKVRGYEYMPSSFQGDSPFFAVIKDYYFGNPCIKKPNNLVDLNITVKECTYMSRLSQGIVSFQLNIQPTIQAYFRNDISLSSSQIADLIKWIIVQDSYLEDIINVWATEFISRTQYARAISVDMYLLITFFVVIVHYVVAHRSFIVKLDLFFQRYTMMYNILMTIERIQKNKIVRSELISLGFLRQ